MPDFLWKPLPRSALLPGFFFATVCTPAQAVRAWLARGCRRWQGRWQEMIRDVHGHVVNRD